MAKLGILMLDTRFPRILGDVGNPDSFEFPVRYGVVPGATPEAIVQGDPTRFIAQFIQAGRALVAGGCTGLSTTCGFLTLVKSEVEDACGVPVVSSALEQAAHVPAPGILTISAVDLSPAHLARARVPESTPVQGVDDGSFASSILGNEQTLDIEAARAEIMAGADALCAANPHVQSIILECTNMPPYAEDVARHTGRKVYSILTALNAFHAEI